MDFIKKHYEKIILAVVLLGLAGAAAYLPFMVSSIRAELEESIRPTKAKEFQPKDLSDDIALLNRARNPGPVVIAGPEHNTFNPVGWFNNNGTLVKDRFYGRKGPNALKILETRPLYLRIAYEAKELKGDNPRYSFAVTREAAEKRSERRKVTRLARLRDKNDIFIIKEVKGNPMLPEAFVLELLDSNKTITVDAVQEYTEITGHQADLEYPAAASRKFTSQIKGDKISLEKRNYEIVFVSETEVVLSDEKTSKHTTITTGMIQ